MIEAGAVCESFATWHANTLDEYAYRFTGRLFVEPQHGYVVRGTRTLLLESMPYHFYGGTPSFIRYLKQRAAGRRHTIRERAIVSLRDFEDANYFHFYNDVLPKLRVLEAWRETRKLPIVISRRLFERRFFQDALRLSHSLSARQWIVQDDFFVEAEEIYCAKPLPHARENFDFALEVLNAPKANEHGSRRIFLSRGAGRTRGLTNAAEVESVCASFRFEIVDADALELDEQIELFAAARFVVGIHGAGLTNIIFR